LNAHTTCRDGSTSTHSPSPPSCAEPRKPTTVRDDAQLPAAAGYSSQTRRNAAESLPRTTSLHRVLVHGLLDTPPPTRAWSAERVATDSLERFDQKKTPFRSFQTSETELT
jgi:hypothetical protein